MNRNNVKDLGLLKQRKNIRKRESEKREMMEKTNQKKSSVVTGEICKSIFEERRKTKQQKVQEIKDFLAFAFDKEGDSIDNTALFEYMKSCKYPIIISDLEIAKFIKDECNDPTFYKNEILKFYNID